MNCPACKRHDEFVFEENTRVWRCDRCHERFLMKPRGTNEDAKEQLVRVVATNADRIRGMSDKELAEFLRNIRDCGDYDELKLIGGVRMDYVSVLDWLQQPAETEG